jgi:hypothetical protein
MIETTNSEFASNNILIKQINSHLKFFMYIFICTEVSFIMLSLFLHKNIFPNGIDKIKTINSLFLIQALINIIGISKKIYVSHNITKIINKDDILFMCLINFLIFLIITIIIIIKINENSIDGNDSRNLVFSVFSSLLIVHIENIIQKYSNNYNFITNIEILNSLTHNNTSINNV